MIKRTVVALLVIVPCLASAQSEQIQEIWPEQDTAAIFYILNGDRLGIVQLRGDKPVEATAKLLSTRGGYLERKITIGQ